MNFRYDAAFELRYPPLVLFGWGRRAELPGVLQELNGGQAPRVLLVTTRSAARTPGMDELRRLCNHRVAAEVCGVPHDPPLETVDELIRLARTHDVEAVVAVGGGSVIDAAKAAAAVAPFGEHVRPFFDGDQEIPSPGLPLAALPTTAGTGAEITKNAVLTDARRRIKKSLRSNHMVPRVALVDPELTVTMPPALTASSGMDALTQAVESYISLRTNPASQALAAEAVRCIVPNLPVAVERGTDRAARTAMACGSLLTALSFSQGGLGAVHGLAHPIGALLGLEHGFTCGVLLPYVLEWNLTACRDDLDRLAQIAGLRDASGLIRHIRDLKRRLGLPGGLAGAGLKPEHFDHIVQNCRSGSMKANPRPMSDEDVRRLLSDLLC